MMMDKISNREWEALSAYLDGELAPKERTRLELQLKENRDLRDALQELRRTRTILRSQPKLRAPRNFTLTPEMVGRRVQTRSTGRAYPIFRLASALATLLLVLVLVGDFFTAAPIVSTTGRSSAPAVVQMAPAEAQTATNAPPAMGGGASQEAQVEAPEAPLADQSTPAAESRMQAQSLPEGTPSPSDQPMLSMAPKAVTPEPAEPEAAPSAKEAPTEQAAESQALTSPAETPTEAFAETVQSEQPVKGLQHPAVRYIEVGLALLAVISGLVALYLRRAGSP